MLRTSTLESRGPGKLELAWKQTPRGNVKRAEDSTPVFAEMAAPGSVFEGEWHQNAFLSQPEIGKALRRSAPIDAGAMFELVNGYTEQLLRIQRQYAEWTGLALLKSTVEQLEARLAQVREAKRGCVLPLGWGAGFLSKVAILNTQDEAYRGILRQVGLVRARDSVGAAVPEDAANCVLGESAGEYSGVRAFGSHGLGRSLGIVSSTRAMLIQAFSCPTSAAGRFSPCPRRRLVAWSNERKRDSRSSVAILREIMRVASRLADLIFGHSALVLPLRSFNKTFPRIDVAMVTL